jgi:hypothetical protein
MTAVAVTLLIVALVAWAMTGWSMYADERTRRVRAERHAARLTAELTKARTTARRAWNPPTPPNQPRVHVPITAPDDTQETPMAIPRRPHYRQRLLALTGLVAVVLAAGAACIPQPRILAPFSNPSPTVTTEVVVFGDSLGAMARQPALTMWADQSAVSVSYNAAGGTEAVDWLPAMSLVGPGQCVIWELGTNDLSRVGATQAEWNALAALNELADADTVVALTLNTTSGDLRGAPFAAATRHYNQFLRQLVRDGTYPNLVLLDWDARSAGRTDWLVGPVPGGDVLHYGGTVTADGTVGNHEFARALVDASAVC